MSTVFAVGSPGINFISSGCLNYFPVPPLLLKSQSREEEDDGGGELRSE